jgi:hypothetical protein
LELLQDARRKALKVELVPVKLGKEVVEIKEFLIVIGLIEFSEIVSRIFLAERRLVDRISRGSASQLLQLTVSCCSHRYQSQRTS